MVDMWNAGSHSALNCMEQVVVGKLKYREDCYDLTSTNWWDDSVHWILTLTNALSFPSSISFAAFFSHRAKESIAPEKVRWKALNNNVRSPMSSNDSRVHRRQPDVTALALQTMRMRWRVWKAAADARRGCFPFVLFSETIHNTEIVTWPVDQKRLCLRSLMKV